MKVPVKVRIGRSLECHKQCIAKQIVKGQGRKVELLLPICPVTDEHMIIPASDLVAVLSLWSSTYQHIAQDERLTYCIPGKC